MITGERAIELLEQVVAERGEDFVYELPDGIYSGCVYADPKTGEGSCGVGRALEIGHPEYFEILRQYEAENDGSIGIDSAPDVRDYLDSSAILVFSYFQINQDQGDKYSDALAKAKSVIV